MMTATKCPTPNELRAMSLGELDELESEELVAHLNACTDCQRELETIEDGEDSLIANLRTEDPHDEFDGEPDCKLALAKALGALVAGSPRDNDHSLDLPKTIGEYRIVQPLGQGGMGTVFLAQHTKLGREVAIKLIANHRLADPKTRHRFESEMRAIGKLSHPNIVTAFDARDVEGTAVLVTEYIDGWDLRQLLKRSGPLRVADACQIGRLVAAALNYTNSQGFVHRDIKPSNIMLSTSGEIKLLDLGLARLQIDDSEQPDMTATGQAMGTADYVAPEQVTDSRAVDVRADIYSLGCTLFKLLTGRAPFADPKHPTTFAKMTAHVSEQPPSLAESRTDLPPDLVQLVDSMLKKDPTARPQSPEEVARELAKFVESNDLQELADTAASCEQPLHSPSLGTKSHSPQPKPKKRSLLFRPVPFFVAIATGLIGTGIGIALGIIITVEHPDGTTSTHRFPDNSKISVRETPETSDEAHEQNVENREAPSNTAPESATTGGTTNSQKQSLAKSNLEKIATAMTAYRSEMGRFPGTANTTEPATQDKGLRVYPFSWRVAILPYIGRQDLYDEYRFQEPWDSDHNAKLIERMPEIYRSPHAHLKNPTTNYFGFVGEDTALGTGNGLKISDFKDGPSQTLLLIESNQSLPWTIPQDLQYVPIIRNSFSGVPLMFVTADGTVHTTDESNAELLKSLITRNGGEKIAMDELSSPPPRENSSARRTTTKAANNRGPDWMQGIWQWAHPEDPNKQQIALFHRGTFVSANEDSANRAEYTIVARQKDLGEKLTVKITDDQVPGWRQTWEWVSLPIGTVLVRIEEGKSSVAVPMRRISGVPDHISLKGNPIVRRAIETLRPEVNAALNGIWDVSLNGSTEATLIFHNGRFVFDKKSERTQRGTYSIGAKEISLTHRDNQSGSSLEKLNILAGRTSIGTIFQRTSDQWVLHIRSPQPAATADEFQTIWMNAAPVSLAKRTDYQPSFANERSRRIANWLVPKRATPEQPTDQQTGNGNRSKANGANRVNQPGSAGR